MADNSGKDISSKDSVIIAVNFRIQYTIPPVGIVNNETHPTKRLAETLREALGTKILNEILMEKKKQISQSTKQTLDEAPDPWGMKVEHVEVKDVRLQEQLLRAMADYVRAKEMITEDKTDKGTYICEKWSTLIMGGIVIIILALLLAFLNGSSVSNVGKYFTSDGQSTEDFEARVVKLQQQFKNQDEVLWNALRRLGTEHIAESEPSRPLVFVLVSTPDNSEELNCFSRSVARAFVNKGDYSLLDGSDIVRRSQSKPDVDEDMERNLKSSSTYPVLLFKDLESLPYDVASLFFKYCDNEDAPYPKAIFIFTLTIKGDNSVLSSLTRKEITEKSYEYLTTVAWKDGEKAKIDALIARIVNPYPLSVKKEDSSLLKEVC